MAKRERLPKDLVLLQLAMMLQSGQELTYARLIKDFLLERRTAERYMKDLRTAGLPIITERDGREAVFLLDKTRNKSIKIEAIDVPPSAAQSLSLLLVAAALLPAHLGVREAVDTTVRAALRLRGMRASEQLRAFENSVIVLENDAKNYEGIEGVFDSVLSATLSGELLRVDYRSPRNPKARREVFHSATIGLYRGGLYTLAVYEGEDGRRPIWRALERIIREPIIDSRADKLDAKSRLRALDEASKRWGPASPRDESEEQIITLHFSKNAAPYVLARPWHPLAESELIPDDQGGGLRMGIRLSGQTTMFESWVRSWGPEVQVLRPQEMAERIADSLEKASQLHRQASADFRRLLED